MFSLLFKALLHRPDKRLLTQFKPPVLPTMIHRQRLVIDTAHYHQYCQLAQWKHETILHPCFLQVVSLPMQLACLSHKRSPFPLLGLIHRANSIQQLGQPNINEAMDFSVGFQDITPHKYGWDVTVFTKVTQHGAPCYDATATYLVRAPGPHTKTVKTRGVRKAPSKRSENKDKAQYQGTLTAPSNIGRRYAKVSKDANPIHLFAATAKLFGFPRAIAHGMWSLAYCVSKLELTETSQDITVQCDFRKPLLLPSKADLFVYADNNESHFNLINQKGGATHINGYVAQSSRAQ
ncbi:MaoC/PaaZ C-terminal domain-containing protein [Alteromonas sp. C1M14]|uniref:MaoC/PaaZ C-terminal domain-containing protein n=1 Tax=Alteromonas sp. C1M14 TaxID=2841567 RepID=UPI001C092D65|nr:MaoC/PaaZ C-terminal domain-containing protein [Alteromonas sp. C1M14]MBU2979088.1 hypothetical protein [Alteromonas sp. C1M14]